MNHESNKMNQKGGIIMKGFKKGLLLFLTISMTIGSLYSGAWALNERNIADPSTHEVNIVDLLIARPLGIVAGIMGTGIFVVSLPFTVPTGGTKEAARMFIAEPFKFSFTRGFNEEDMD
jgi:hypothetical protein